MPNGPIKIFKSLLRSTPAGHIKLQRVPVANITKR